MLLYLLVNLRIAFVFCHVVYFFFFKQKTAYELRISDWSSDVCSSDLTARRERVASSSASVTGRQTFAGTSRFTEGSSKPQSRVEHGRLLPSSTPEIGRASCRDRVCQYV